MTSSRIKYFLIVQSVHAICTGEEVCRESLSLYQNRATVLAGVDRRAGGSAVDGALRGNLQMQMAVPVRGGAVSECSGHGWQHRAYNQTTPSCALLPHPPLNTRCPDAVWIDDMIVADSSPGKVIMSIGCNKANDLVAWLERYDMSAANRWSTKAWVEQIERTWPRGGFFACQPDFPAVTAYEFMKDEHVDLPEGQLNEKTIGVCVEPVPETIQLIRDTHATLRGPEVTSLQIIQAAVAASAREGETVDFDDPVGGTETSGLTDKLVQIPVTLTTVDAIVRENQLGRVDVLQIDTEGGDADVLKGATETLKSVRYLEFEVHRDLERTSWSRTTLRSVVEDLANMSFDCYWAGENGKLVNVLDCWQDDFECGDWANVVCAKRGDVWSTVLQRFASS